LNDRFSALTYIPSFSKLRLDVKNSTAEVRLYVPGTPLDPLSPVLLPYPVVLIPRVKSVYFVPPESFSLVAMMSNPMMLLMVLGGGMMLAMPYIMVGSVFPFRLVSLKAST
jgi:ER membrane protein complex subunit 7